MASLAGGFRKLVLRNATEMGIAGTIQRYYVDNILLKIEGNGEQLDQFFAFLRLCVRQGMMSSIEIKENQEIPYPLRDDFTIRDGHGTSG